MNQRILYFLAITMVYGCFVSSCKDNPVNRPSHTSVSIDSLLNTRYKKLVEYPIDSMAFPRSFVRDIGQINKVPSRDWTSGFFPGNLWQLYELTGNDRYKQRAIEWTKLIEREKFNGGTHDMGFKVYCSFGNGYELTDNKEFREIIVKSAKTLCTRFNPKVGSLRSWDFNEDIWEFPVIIDNMMNLELLFEATRITGDSTYHKIAVSHANTTLKNHFREDNSSYHVVVYDTITGAVKDKVTHQGFHRNSAWARGQAWGIYGFTMCYRYTKDLAYMDQAVASTSFFINNPKLPNDGIPYWDFNVPSTANAPKDVSAAAIVASALLELGTYTQNPAYEVYTKKVLNSLKSPKYILDRSVDAPFILDHSTGNWPAKDEIDVPLVYGDYYFLEALLRKKNGNPFTF